jgi:hypothetical protein
MTNKHTARNSVVNPHLMLTLILMELPGSDDERVCRLAPFGRRPPDGGGGVSATGADRRPGDRAKDAERQFGVDLKDDTSHSRIYGKGGF